MKTKSMLKIEFCNGCKKGMKPGSLADSGPPKFQRLCPDCLRWQCKVCGFVCRSVLDRARMDVNNGVCPACMATYQAVLKIVVLRQTTVPKGNCT